jgi:hypothetical protein
LIESLLLEIPISPLYFGKVAEDMRFAFVLALLAVGCQAGDPLNKTNAPTQTQVLPITLGGFIEGHPEAGHVDGACGIKSFRETLICDFYNGLQDWSLTEITVVVVRSPYTEDTSRYFKIPVSMKPLTSEHQDIRLGLQLPRDKHQWNWNIVGATGHHI